MSRLGKLAAWLQGSRGTSRTKVFEYRSTRIWIDGQETPVEGVDQELLEKIASQLGVSADERVGELGDESIQGTLAEALGSTVSTTREVRTHGPPRRVDCPRCQRTIVDRTGYCLYCGEVLASQPSQAQGQRDAPVQQEVRPQPNPVDAKYLNSEVTGDESAQEEENQDSFLQRLRRL